MSRPPSSRLADPTAMTASEAAAAIRTGRLTSLDLVKACLARIADRDGQLQAFEFLDADRVLAAARAADARQRSGAGIGPLHGVAIAIKDIIDTADMPTCNGSPLFAGRQPEHDAACVAGLRRAGAVIIGKTVTTELALLTPSRTRNPLDPERTPGGSSAGSAAAVAAHMVPAALGTQTAGSVLRPASYCGLYGYKPTLGLIPRAGVLPQSHTLDTVGILARSLDDVALIADCLAAHEAGDAASLDVAAPALLAASMSPIHDPPRLAFVRTPAWGDGTAAMHAAVERFVRRLGASVDEIEIDGLGAAIEDQRTIQLAENAAYYGPLHDRAPEQLSAGLKVRLDIGLKLPATTYIAALRRREPAYRAAAAVLDRYAAILTPAAPGAAPLLSEGITGNPVFNGVWTYFGMPAITLPLLQADKMPLGVQLVGRRRDDGRLLRKARWLVAMAGADAT